MKYAIVEKNQVVNRIIVTDDIAKTVFPEAIKETEATGKAWIGARFNGYKFEPRQPYPSWVWNEEAFSYDPPKSKPEGDYYWDEELGDWQAIEEPEAEA